jgi:hypothetical protein
VTVNGTINADGGNGGDGYGSGGGGGGGRVYIRGASAVSVTGNIHQDGGLAGGGATHGSFPGIFGSYFKPVVPLVIDTAPSGTWTPWLLDVSNNVDISALGTKRYVQYRFNYTTNGIGALPGSTTVGEQQLYEVGDSSIEQARGGYIVPRPGGGYRLYYDYNNGSYWQLAYRDTTNTDAPSSANLGPQVLMNIGSSANYGVAPIPVAMPGGGYRLYYTVNDVNNGYTHIVYEDTSDGNLPDETNLGGTPTPMLGTGVNDRAAYGSLLQLAGGDYRFYYGYYDGTYWRTRYVDATDSNLPGAANIGVPVDVTGTSATDMAIGGSVLQLSSGRYRLYYPYNAGNGGGWRLAYKDTTDTNPPSGTNLGGQVLLGLGDGATSDQILEIQPYLLPNGQFRISYGYNNGTYWQLAYSDAGVSTVSPSLYSIQANEQAVAVPIAVELGGGSSGGGGASSVTELLALGLCALCGYLRRDRRGYRSAGLMPIREGDGPCPAAPDDACRVVRRGPLPGCLTRTVAHPPAAWSTTQRRRFHIK